MRHMCGALMFAFGICSVTSGAIAASPTTGNVEVLIAEKGQPDSKQITNAEDHPLKGKVWTYSSGNSRQDYLIRDGKVRWIREIRDDQKTLADHTE